MKCLGGDDLNIINNRKGSALIVAILVLAVLMILSTTMVSISSSNFEMSHAERRYLSAYYVAEAGIRHQIEHMRVRFEELQRRGGHTSADAFFLAFNNNKNTPITAAPLILQNQINDTARANIVMALPLPHWGERRTYNFTSTATVGNLVRRIQGSVTIRWARMQPPPVFFNYAVFADEQIIMDNGSRVTGNVATNATAAEKVRVSGGARIAGDVNVGPGGSLSTVKVEQGGKVEGAITVSSTIVPIPQIVSPYGLLNKGALNVGGGQNLSISTSRFHTSMNINNGATLNINLSATDLVIRTGSFTLTGGARLNLNGNGRLYLFVDGNFSVDNGAKMNENGDSSELVIMLSGTNNVVFGGGVRINAALYASNSGITVGNGARLVGSIMAKEAIISGGGRVDYATIAYQDISSHLAPIPNFIPPEYMFRDISWQEQ